MKPDEMGFSLQENLTAKEAAKRIEALRREIELANSF